MSSLGYGLLVALALMLILLTGPVNTLIVVGALWGIMLLIENFPGLDHA